MDLMKRFGRSKPVKALRANDRVHRSVAERNGFGVPLLGSTSGYWDTSCFSIAGTGSTAITFAPVVRRLREKFPVPAPKSRTVLLLSSPSSPVNHTSISGGYSGRPAT